ncbi:hypothetical protein V1512DRAFT_261789 [Lipomyces arxii]|uniref:uncharacterized protein n=1 Tax=Lipomyces arxii TaxID=56418 RepID=UPI0034CDB483
MSSSRGRRLTGLQKEVLGLYRKCLREVRKKPENARTNFLIFTRRQFEPHLSLSKSDFATIEYLMRKGNQMLETYSNPGVRNVSV